MPITIAKRKSFNDWITIEEGIRIKIDYPTREQSQKLNDLMLDTSEDKIPRKNMMKYMNFYLKFTIKDWEGIKDEQGSNVECKLVGNELETNLWYDLIQQSDVASTLFGKINEALEVTETDKKK